MSCREVGLAGRVASREDRIDSVPPLVRSDRLALRRLRRRTDIDDDRRCAPEGRRARPAERRHSRIQHAGSSRPFSSMSRSRSGGCSPRSFAARSSSHPINSPVDRKPAFRFLPDRLGCGRSRPGRRRGRRSPRSPEYLLVDPALTGPAAGRRCRPSRSVSGATSGHSSAATPTAAAGPTSCCSGPATPTPSTTPAADRPSASSCQMPCISTYPCEHLAIVRRNFLGDIGYDPFPTEVP